MNWRALSAAHGHDDPAAGRVDSDVVRLAKRRPGPVRLRLRTVKAKGLHPVRGRQGHVGNAPVDVDGQAVRGAFRRYLRHLARPVLADLEDEQRLACVSAT